MNTETTPVATPATPAIPDETAPVAASWPTLSPVEARVLGALIEKQYTTPDYYPLTLNALVAACNQKNNRDPMTQFDDAIVLAATDTLREKKLAWQVFLAGNRVPKYRHAFTDVYHVPDETVPLLCELMLRGPQTAAELRTRGERMHAYTDVASVEALLQQLVTHREGVFAVKLPRESGRRESRFAHLLSGPVAAAAAAPTSPPAEPVRVTWTQEAARLTQMEQALADLQARVQALEKKLDAVL